MSRALKILLSVVLLGQVASAQTETGTTPGSVDVTVPQRSTLTAEDMAKQASEYRTAMADVLTRLQSMVDEARGSKDVIKLNCLNDKLVQTKANVNVADKAMQGLQEAMAQNDEGGRIYEYTRVTLIHQKIQVLAAEAEGCVGEELGFVGPTRVDVDVDPNVRRDDVTSGAIGPVIDVFRPPPASPFL